MIILKGIGTVVGAKHIFPSHNWYVISNGIVIQDLAASLFAVRGKIQVKDPE